MKRISILIASAMLLSFFYLNLNAKTSHRLVGFFHDRQLQEPEFYRKQTSHPETIGEKILAQILPQSAPTQTAQTQTQTQSQTLTQTQTQSQTQTQDLFIGFPLQNTWKYKTNAPLVAQPQTDEATVYIASKAGGVHRVQQLDGKMVWRANVGDNVEDAFLLLGGTLFVGTTGGRIHAVSADRGKSLWKKEFREESFMTRPASDETNLYFVSQKGSILRIDQKTGQPVWRFKAQGPCLTAAWYYSGKVFAGCNDKNLYALDTAAGFVKWKFTADAEIQGSPIAGPEGVFFGSEDGNFYALDLETGILKWKYKTGGAVRGVPMFYKNEDTGKINDIITTSFDNILYCLKTKNGGRSWLSFTGARVYSRMHFDRALIFLAPFGSSVLGYDPHTGKMVGDFNPGNRIRSAPITANDRLFLGLNDGRLVCLTRQPPPPPESEQTQTQTQTQTQSQTQTQTQTQTEPEEQTEPMLESQTQTQTQTQSQTQTQTSNN